MYQAIQTKYFGPSNVRGARVKAIADAGSITLHWNHALGVEGNHAAARAARFACANSTWDGRWVGGGMKDHGYCFVLAGDESAFHVAPSSNSP